MLQDGIFRANPVQILVYQGRVREALIEQHKRKAYPPGREGARQAVNRL